MKIVFYSSIFFTDCDFSLIREMQRHGIEITYYIQIVKGKQCGGLLDLRSYNFSTGIFEARNFSEFNIYADFIDLSNIHLIVRTANLKDLHNWKTYATLTYNIYRLNPDYIHISNALGVSEGFLYCFYRKMVMTVHDPFMHSGEFTKSSEIKRKLAFHLVRKLVLLNKKQYEQFSSEYKINRKKIYFNRLGIYGSLQFLADKYALKKSPTINYILFFGHISPYKGVDVLCEAMVKVHQYYPNIQCIIAGKGDLYFDYGPFKNSNYITLMNRFIDTLELVDLISNSMFVVCPYKDATQSGVIASSFAMSKPVLASNVGGLSESVIDGVTGLLIPPNNVDALAGAIIKMLGDKSLIEKFSGNIKRIFDRGEMSWATIAKKYIEIYEQKN